jgi:hypothetical protein
MSNVVPLRKPTIDDTFGVVVKNLRTHKYEAALIRHGEIIVVNVKAGRYYHFDGFDKDGRRWWLDLKDCYNHSFEYFDNFLETWVDVDDD